MTLNEFFKRLKATPRDWRITSKGYLRSGDRCPIDALGGRWLSPNGGLGLRRLTRWRIVDSADAYGESNDPKLRVRLLKACGLPQ